MHEDVKVAYAVIFKTYYYSNDQKNNLLGILKKSKFGKLYVVFDSTNQEDIKFDFDNVLYILESDLIERGFLDYPPGKMFWYNADYPIYCFTETEREYDYYVMVEHDAVVQCDLDALVHAAYATGTDLIAQRIETPLSAWRWTGSCGEVFSEDEIDPRMVCFSVFSRRAVMALRAARLAQSAAWRRGALRHWPIAEGFVGSELRRQGMRVRDLHHFGALNRYDVWPPVHPWQLPFLRDQAVIHPVLTGRRYLRVLLRNGLSAAIRALLGLASAADLARRHIWTARGGATAAACQTATEFQHLTTPGDK